MRDPSCYCSLSRVSSCCTWRGDYFNCIYVKNCILESSLISTWNYMSPIQLWISLSFFSGLVVQSIRTAPSPSIFVLIEGECIVVCSASKFRDGMGPRLGNGISPCFPSLSSLLLSLPSPPPPLSPLTPLCLPLSPLLPSSLSGSKFQLLAWVFRIAATIIKSFFF